MAAKTMADPLGTELKQTLRALKLGRMLDTMPERLTLAKQQHLVHAAFLQLVLADEVSRQEAKSARLQSRAAGLDPGMRIDTGTRRLRSDVIGNCGTSSPRCGSLTARTGF